jgi:hypothetical protein
MPAKPDSKRILIKISGDEVSPETVRASDLAEFLINFEKAVLTTAMASKDFIPESSDAQLIFSLVSIESGSESLIFALTSEFTYGVSLISRAHLSQDYSTIPFEAHQSLHEISKQANSRSWAVEFVEDKKLSIPLSVISADTPFPAPKTVTVQGDTTVYGRLIRVGGVKPKAMLELPDKKYLFIDLSERMAVVLASKERLYKDVGIEGIATWRVDTWELIRFKAKRVTQYQPHKNDIVKSFEALSETVGDRWDNIDVEQLIAEMRGRTKS